MGNGDMTKPNGSFWKMVGVVTLLVAHALTIGIMIGGARADMRSMSKSFDEFKIEMRDRADRCDENTHDLEQTLNTHLIEDAD